MFEIFRISSDEDPSKLPSDLPDVSCWEVCKQVQEALFVADDVPFCAHPMCKSIKNPDFFSERLEQRERAVGFYEKVAEARRRGATWG